MMEIQKYCFCYNPKCRWEGSDEESVHCPECGSVTFYTKALLTGGMTVFVNGRNLIIRNRVNPDIETVIQQADIEDLLHFINTVMVKKGNIKQEFLKSAYVLLNFLKNEEEKTKQELDSLPAPEQEPLEAKEKISGSRIKVLFRESRRKKEIKDMEELIEKFQSLD